MRIALVTREFPPDPGGIGRFMGDVVEALASHEVHVYVPASGQQRALREHGRLHESALAGRLGRKPHAYRLQGVALSWALLGSGRHYDLVLCACASHLLLLPAVLMRLLHGTPYMTFVHGYDVLHVAKWPIYQRILVSTLSRGRAVLANSFRTQNELRMLGVASGRIRIVHPVVDPGGRQVARSESRASVRLRRGSAEGILLLSVGALVRRKGHDTVLRALAVLCDAGLTVRYAIVGTGPDEARLVRLAKDLGVSDFVTFAGFVPDAELAAWYEAADVFVLPARDLDGDIEGFGIVFLEAACHSLPVVAGRSGGVEDAVVHGETGLLVNPSSAEDVAAAIAVLAADADRRADMGRRGRSRALSDFGPATLRRALERILNE